METQAQSLVLRISVYLRTHGQRAARSSISRLSLRSMNNSSRAVTIASLANSCCWLLRLCTEMMRAERWETVKESYSNLPLIRMLSNRTRHNQANRSCIMRLQDCLPKDFQTWLGMRSARVKYISALGYSAWRATSVGSTDPSCSRRRASLDGLSCRFGDHPHHFLCISKLFPSDPVM